MCKCLIVCSVFVANMFELSDYFFIHFFGGVEKSKLLFTRTFSCLSNCLSMFFERVEEGLMMDFFKNKIEKSDDKRHLFLFTNIKRNIYQECCRRLVKFKFEASKKQLNMQINWENVGCLLAFSHQFQLSRHFHSF